MASILEAYNHCHYCGIVLNVSSFLIEPNRVIHTEMMLAPEEFDNYQIGVDTEVTFCLKELRVSIQLTIKISWQKLKLILIRFIWTRINTAIFAIKKVKSSLRICSWSNLLIIDVNFYCQHFYLSVLQAILTFAEFSSQPINMHFETSGRLVYHKKIYNYIRADYEQLREKEECYLKIKQEKLLIWVQVYNPETCFPA